MAQIFDIIRPLLLASFFCQLALGSPLSLLKRATGRTSPPSGCLVVRQSTSSASEYSTIASAVTAVKPSGCIFIYSGTYTEQLSIRVNNLTIYGYTADVSNYKSNTVTITHKLGSYDAGSLDASSTVNVVSSDFRMYNVIVENTYGTAGQAVALTSNGMRQGFYGCSFKSFQDTLYAKAGYQYYSNCYMEGAVDFIFGNGAAWFGECTIAASRGGYITANSRTYPDDPAWYVFDHSTIAQITAASGVSVERSVFLGRPWRVEARVIYQYSQLTNVVHPEGWTTMAANATPTFMEFQNTGDGADISNRKWLAATSTAVSKSQLWPENSGWYDKSY
ncbi:pectin lyase-like protein [Corynespora cassiicola Philippines]|uniref:pectinesterase n=1 Tax=Corynespora cassiicola Philippines TaxID=1448308 RepID=A0A2T2NZE9_CORCC|nr:pectin lyase-like protein [Corynespora cassiicola Philippines]